MDNKALFNLTYGMFMLSTKWNDTENGCITNTCMQVAANPTRIAISCINQNYTTELIKKSGVFCLSVLDNTCTFNTISHFGMQSGRTTNKFSDLTLPKDKNGIPYLSYHTNAVLHARVVQSHDLGSHTLFIAEIEDASVCSQNAPLTYAEYHAGLKPKPQASEKSKKPIKWKCKICGYIYEGAELPADFLCPLCGHPASDFEPVYEL